MMKGTVFNIQRFCVNDGPGIRTTVFLKGCPLRCMWCHNPESHSSKPQVFWDSSLCIGCGRCKTACPNGALGAVSLCIGCGSCAEVCPTGARERTGEEMTVFQVMDTVLRDREFYGTTGGMTLSGGEPLCQPEFTLSLLTKAKENGLHTCVETCGYAAKETVCKIAEHTDLFLYDWKLSDSQLHKQYTGVSNECILENLLLLDRMGKDIVLRCPIIPGINDTDGHFTTISKLTGTLEHILHVELEPYHALGTDKSKRLGTKAVSYPEPSGEMVDHWKNMLAKASAKPIKIG